MEKEEGRTWLSAECVPDGRAAEQLDLASEECDNATPPMIAGYGIYSPLSEIRVRPARRLSIPTLDLDNQTNS
jgi:hypothetical protein